MSNFLIGFNNKVDTATLSAGSWVASLPLNNLKDYRTAKKARTTDATAANTQLRFALVDLMYIGVVGLISTNASADATYRLKLFSDAGFTTVVYDSGTLSLYPTGSLPPGARFWGSPELWSGKPTNEELNRWQRNVIHTLSASTLAKYGEIQITDTGNAAGYFEAGRLFVGKIWQPLRNPSEAHFQLASRTAVTHASDGTPYFKVERPDFSMPFALKNLNLDEAMLILDIQALADVHGEILVMWDPSEIAYWFRRQVFGRLKQLDPVEHPHYATYAASFQVEGQL